MDGTGTVDEDIRRLIDRAIDPEFARRLVADPEGIIRANGWSIAPDRLVAALRSAGVAQADVEVLQSRISYSGLGRLVSSAIHIGHDAHSGPSPASAHGDARTASADHSESTGPNGPSSDATATPDAVTAAAPDAGTATAPDAVDADGDGAAVPFTMDDGMKSLKAAPVDGVPDESGD
jgi:hypothetical protein